MLTRLAIYWHVAVLLHTVRRDVSMSTYPPVMMATCECGRVWIA